MPFQQVSHVCFDEDSHKEISWKIEPPRTQSTAALQVLIGLVSGLICDRKLDDKEINFLDNWLKENITMNDIYPVNIYIRNIQAILEDKSISSAEREQFLRFLEKQAKFDDRLYVSCEYIDALIEVLRLAQGSKWQEGLAAAVIKPIDEESDEVIKTIGDEPAARWVRATLHKKLGDEENSRYQYRYTSIKYEDYTKAEDEIEAIIKRLGIDFYVAVKPKEQVC